MSHLLDALSTREQLHASDVYRVYLGAIVGKQCGEWSAVDLGAVDHRYRLSVQPVALGEDGVVDVQVLENLEDGERGAGEDGLPHVGRVVEVAHVVVHVGQVLEGETLDVLLKRHRLLDVVVLGDIIGPYWEVHEDAVHLVVFVGVTDLLLEGFFVDSAQVEVETTGFSESDVPSPPDFCIPNSNPISIVQSSLWLGKEIRALLTSLRRSFANTRHT